MDLMPTGSRYRRRVWTLVHSPAGRISSYRNSLATRGPAYWPGRNCGSVRGFRGHRCSAGYSLSFRPGPARALSLREPARHFGLHLSACIRPCGAGCVHRGFVLGLGVVQCCSSPIRNDLPDFTRTRDVPDADVAHQMGPAMDGGALGFRACFCLRQPECECHGLAPGSKCTDLRGRHIRTSRSFGGPVCTSRSGCNARSTAARRPHYERLIACGRKLQNHARMKPGASSWARRFLIATGEQDLPARRRRLALLLGLMTALATTGTR
jgi:hypothetical protein